MPNFVNLYKNAHLGDRVHGPCVRFFFTRTRTTHTDTHTDHEEINGLFKVILLCVGL